jgi:hypothetical protein
MNEKSQADKTEVHDDKLLIGHQYDGIQELDNNLPQWWLYGFYFSIAFAVIYMFYFEVLGAGPTMEQEYLREMSQAGYRVPPVDEVASAFEEKMLGLVSILCCALVLVVSKVIRIDRDSQQQH